MAIIPGVNTPTSVSGQGAIKRDNGTLQGHIFASGIEKPQILETLLVQFPNYYLLSLTDKIAGASVDGLQSNKALSWNIMGRTRRSATATNVANGTTASATITTDIPATDANAAGYFLVGDTIFIPNSKARGRVDAVGIAGGFQTITVSRSGGGNWSTSLLNTGFRFGHIGSRFGEGSTRAGFRSYLPNQEWNIPVIMRRGIQITRSMMQDKTWIDNDTWYYKQEEFEQKEFLRDVEATAIFGSRFQASSLQSPNDTRGYLEYAELFGKSATYSSAVGAQEADLIYLVQQLLPEQGAQDLILLSGEKQFLDLQTALGNNYRQVPMQEKPAELAGLNFQSYEIGGKKIHFTYYELFSDDAVVPQVAPSSDAVDFRDFGLILDFGMVSGGQRNIQLGYVDRIIQKHIAGMASDSFDIASTFDGEQFELLTEFMPLCFSPNRLAILRSNS